MERSDSVYTRPYRDPNENSSVQLLQRLLMFLHSMKHREDNRGGATSSFSGPLHMMWVDFQDSQKMNALGTTAMYRDCESVGLVSVLN